MTLALITATSRSASPSGVILFSLMPFGAFGYAHGDQLARC